MQADKRRCFAKHRKRQKVETAIGATAANVGKVPRLSGSWTTQRRALFIEPVIHFRRREGVLGAQSVEFCAFNERPLSQIGSFRF